MPKYRHWAQRIYTTTNIKILPMDVIQASVGEAAVCLKVLTFCFYRKAFYILVKWLITHDILTISEFFIFSILSSGFRLC